MPLLIGNCFFDAPRFRTVVLENRRYRTDLKGWRFHGFCKTQYASLHGWEYFRRCHTAVVDLLIGMRRCGVEEEIHDEGDYWPGCSLETLRRNLDEMNGIVAAAAGALKDFDEATNGRGGVQSPIFSHRNFERLEAEGEVRVGPALNNLRIALGKL